MPEPPRPGGPGAHLPEWLGVRNAEDVLFRLLGYAEACGPVARVTLGPVSLVLVADPEAAAAVLSDPRANHKGAAYVLTRAVLDNVLLLNGHAWETHRRVYRQALRGVEPLRSANAVASRVVADLGSRAGVAPLLLDDVIFRMVGDVVAHFVAGTSLTDAFEPHRRRVQYELAAIGIDLQCQPWAYLSPLRWVRLRRSVSAARAFFRDAVRERMARPHDDTPDVLGGFLAMARAGEYPMEADAIQEGVVNFFFTAHDVLASSTAWTAWLLAQHADIEATLRSELPAGELGRAELDASETLACVAREGIRLYPGYGLFGRTTQAPMEIAGYEVPRGTMLIASPFVTHRLEAHWDEPRRFDPERWRGKARGTPAPTAKGGYFPFGSGARSCLASHLAFPILQVLIGRLVKALELRAVPGHDPQLSYWGTSYARAGMPVHVRAAS